MGSVSLSALRVKFVQAKVSLGHGRCPLFGVERCPLLGGSECISVIVKSIRGKCFVRCIEVVRFSEGPQIEVSLYSYFCRMQCFNNNTSKL